MKIRFKKDVAGHSAGDTKHIVSSIDWAMTYGDMLADGLIEVIPEYNPYEPKKAWSDLDMQDFALYICKHYFGDNPKCFNESTLGKELSHWKNRVTPCTIRPRSDYGCDSIEHIRKDLSAVADQINVEASKTMTIKESTGSPEWRMLQGLSRIISRIVNIL